MIAKKAIWVVRHAQSNHQIGLQKLVIEEDDVRRIWLWDAWSDWEEARTM